MNGNNKSGAFENNAKEVVSQKELSKETRGIRIDVANLGDIATDSKGNFNIKELAKNLHASIPFIETNAEKAAQIATTVDVGAERVDEDVQKMYSKIQNVGEIWQGQDSEAFKESFEELKTRINQNVITLNNVANTIKREAEITAAQNRKFTELAKDREHLY